MFEPEHINFRSSLRSDEVSVEEILLDSEVNSFHGSLESGLGQNGGFKFLTIVLLVGLSVIFLRLFDLQIRRGDNYLLAAEGNRIRYVQKFSPRGQILDRHGQILARNIPNFELVVVPYDLPKDSESRHALFARIGEVTGQTVEEIERRLEAAGDKFIEPVSIRESLSQEEALRLESIVSQNNFLRIQSAPVREYIDGPVFSNILGYVGKLTREDWDRLRDSGYYFNDVIGKQGVELVYEEILRGQHGRIEVEVDAEGNLVKELREIAPQPGSDLKLTINSGLQRVIYNALQKSVVNAGEATGGAAVAMDPRTGEILALVTFPSYDNNLFAKGIKQADYESLLSDPRTPFLNRPLAGVYPPGSTIKPIIGLAALEEGIITDKTKILDEGVIRAGGYTFYGWDRDGLGLMDIYQAIARSSDPFFYVVGGGYGPYGIEGLGVDKIVEYLRKFKLGSKLDISLGGEEAGLVPTPEWKKQRFAGTDEQNWYLGNTYHLSIGQGYLLVTPLQLTVAMAAIANDGRIMKPIISQNENIQELGNIGVDQRNLDIIKKAMRENVLTGSGTRLSHLPVSVAGKTGTAQFDSRDLYRTHAWYTGFAPYENPEIVITVLVESGGEGHVAAVPVVQEALSWWAENR